MFLAAVLARTEKKTGYRDGKALQEFDHIADELVGYSEIVTNSDEHLRILEPTAGSGNLVSAIVRARNDANMNDGYTIEIVEFNPVSWEVLQLLVSRHQGSLVLQAKRLFELCIK
jgi:hypothetical protein